MNGDDVRAASFLSLKRKRGYDRMAVDELLSRVAAEFDAGRSPAALIQNATFPESPYRSYDIEAVDWFLDRLVRNLEESGHPEPGSDCPRLAVAQLTHGGAAAAPDSREIARSFAEECRTAWRTFDEPPSSYLRWERVRGRFWSTHFQFRLRTADQQTIAAVRGWPISLPFTASTAGQTFTSTTPEIRFRSSADSWPPGIAELAASSWQDQAGHYTDQTMGNDAQRRQARTIRELIDEAGTPILYISGASYNHRACVRVTFPNQQWLRFLVRGTRRQNAIMTAVDQAGNTVARCRIVRSDWINGLMVEAEVAVHPDQKLTNELALAIAISPPWLTHYFDDPK